MKREVSLRKKVLLLVLLVTLTVTLLTASSYGLAASKKIKTSYV